MYDKLNVLQKNGFKREKLENAKVLTVLDEELKDMIPAGVFPYYIARTSRWNPKRKALMSIRTAEEVEMEIHHLLYVVTVASNAAIELKQFEHVMDRFLGVCKFLNSGTAKSELPGFKLESLNSFMK